MTATDSNPVTDVRDALERVSDAVITLDEGFVCTYANPGAATVLGTDREALLGRALPDLLPSFPSRTLLPLVSEVVETQESRSLELYNPELDRAYDVRLYPDPAGLSIYCTDVTDRTGGERDLGMWNQQLTALVENATECVYVKDTEGRLAFVNPAAAGLFGLDPEDVVGMYDEDLFDADTAADIRAREARIIEAGGPDTQEVERVIDGKRFTFIENTYPYRDHDGTIIGIMGISSDITDRTRRERGLQRRHDRLDEFASVISHDLQNPIAIAQGRLALLEAECESEHLLPLADALDRIASITGDTLTLARQGDVVTDPGAFGVTDLVGQCWAMIGAADATLEICDELTVVADADRLRHVFENLFKNAVVHGGADVAVRIGCIGDDGFYVEDDGPGVPEAARDEIFAPGHRSQSGGTGFGLTIVRRIAEAHGWTVTVTEGTGGGARFEFTGVDIVDED